MKEFEGLLSRYLEGGVPMEELVAEFETLTFRLTALTGAQEQALAGLTNDLETIRFTLLEQDMSAAVGEVFVRALRVVSGPGRSVGS